MAIHDFFPTFMGYGMVFNQTKGDKPRHTPTPGKRDAVLEDDMCMSLYNGIEYCNSTNRNSKGTIGSRGDIRKKELPTQVNCHKYLQCIYTHLIFWM